MRVFQAWNARLKRDQKVVWCYGSTPQAAARALIESAELQRAPVYEVRIQEGDLDRTEKGGERFIYAIGSPDYRYWAVAPDKIDTLPNVAPEELPELAKIA